MRRALPIAAVVVLSCFQAPDALAQKGRGGTVHVRSYVRKDGTVVKAHTRTAPGTPRMDARTTARASVPIVVRAGPSPAAPGVSEEPRETITSVKPTSRQARTTARYSQPQPSETPAPEDPADKAEREAARMLTLAVSLEESATTERVELHYREADRILDRVKTRYAEIIKKYPRTNAATEARQRLDQLR